MRLERDGYQSQDLRLTFEETTTVKIVLPREVAADAGAAAPIAPPAVAKKPTGTGRRRTISKKPTPATKTAPKLAPTPDKPKKPTKPSTGLVGDLM